MPTLQEQLKLIDEEYLIGISNKGIVNRAKKELPEITVKTDFSNQENSLIATFSDETEVIITGTISSFSCSCPSRSICKHVIMAIMAGMEQLNVNTTTNTNNIEEISASSANDFDYILDFTQDALAKQYGRTVFNDCLSRILSGASAEIEENKLLNIRLCDTGLTTRFFPLASSNESVCSCKQKKCRHRLEALMQYIKFRNGSLNFSFITEEIQVDIDVLPHIKGFIEGVFKIGLNRLPHDYSEKCGHFSVLCHGAGFALLERQMQRCERELELYNKKSSYFNSDQLHKNLTTAYQLCCTYLKDSEKLAMAGMFKQQYTELLKIKLYGLGAYQWYTKSGFCGVTAIFYCCETKHYLTFSTSRPIDGENSALSLLNSLWSTHNTWNLSISLSSLSIAELSLLGAKISSGNRLSSSENTSADLLLPQTSFDSKDISGIIIDDYSKIVDLFSLDAEDEFIYVIVKPQGLTDGIFDRIHQEYHAVITDLNNCKLNLKINYSQINQTAILNLEYFMKNSILPDAMLLSVSIFDRDKAISAFPISVVVDGRTVNIFNDKLYPSGKISEFSKFFEEDVL